MYTTNIMGKLRHMKPDHCEPNSIKFISKIITFSNAVFPGDGLLNIAVEKELVCTSF
jgi:hypothetical protein